MATELLEPVVDSGVRLTNFFNGRVLTAEDLRREQDAAQERHRGLASAVGEGVVRGLEVSIDSRTVTAPSVRVTAGLAFNRDGDPVALPRDVVLRLIPTSAEQNEEAGRFAQCDRPSVEVEITNPGLYLLVVRPASALSSDQVAAVEPTSDGLGTRCGSRYSQQGAAFSVAPLRLPAGGADAPLAQTLTALSSSIAKDVESHRRGDTSDSSLPGRLARNLSKLRNGMAYWCAGYDSLGQRIASLAVSPPLAPAVTLSPLETLRGEGLIATCDVPIALLYITRRQLEWVDMWSVRRAPLPRIGPDPLSLVRGDRPRSDATALVLQFRDQAGSFLASGSPVSPDKVAAPDWFIFLPPAGILPVKTGSLAGFGPTTFFPWSNVQNATKVPKIRAETLLQRAMQEVPVRVDSGKPPLSLFRFLNEKGETTDWENRYVMFVSRTSDGI